MNNFYLGLKFALSYFTILPVRFKKDIDLSTKEILNNLVLSLPLIGLILGTLTLLLYNFLDSIPWLGAIICASFYMILYGFIHTEAVADIADAIYAKHSGKDAYEVIKEPTIGAMGLLYSIVFVLLKVSGILFLFINDLLLEFLAIVIISRVCIQYTILYFDFKSSFIMELKKSFTNKSFIFSILISSILVTFLTELSFLWFFVLAFVLTFIFAKFINKSVGFLNGDALGTILEAIEIVLFLSVCYLWL